MQPAEPGTEQDADRGAWVSGRILGPSVSKVSKTSEVGLTFLPESNFLVFLRSRREVEA